jgi:tetratricopeptide (TPR) repeat protein
MKNVLMCTGFHRSATSVTANYLSNAGLNLGFNLMPGSISNPKGHYEDIEAVRLHDEQLTNSTTNWQFYDECPLATEPDFLKGYVQSRHKQAKQWGIKDPRACLFLNDWKSALNGDGRFLFVARHWSSCLESLLNRHSNDFAYNLPKIEQDNVGFQFWRDPTLAVKMWLSYNQRIIEFVSANKEISLVITQRALFEGAPLIERINTKLGFDLNPEADSPFDISLIRDQANSRIFTGLSIGLQQRLNQMWDKLVSLADFKSDDETPQIVEQTVDVELVNEVEKKIILKTPFSVIENIRHSTNDWLNRLFALTLPGEVEAFLDATKVFELDNINTSEWLPKLTKQFELKTNVLLASAKLLMRAKNYTEAVEQFNRVVVLGLYYPFIDFMLAQCISFLGEKSDESEHASQFNKAEFYYKKALTANPNNGHFYIGYAKFLMMQNRLNEAKTQYVLAYEKAPKQPGVVVAYCVFLENTDKLDDAITILENLALEIDHILINQQLLRLQLKQNISLGKLAYTKSVTEKIKDKNLLGWLAETCLLIDDKQAETDFIKRCLFHWNKLGLLNYPNIK